MATESSGNRISLFRVAIFPRLSVTKVVILVVGQDAITASKRSSSKYCGVIGIL